MRSPSIYPVAHAKHTLNPLRFAAAVQPMNFMRVPHSREKDASLDVTIPGSIQQASGWKLLHLHHQGTPQHDGSVESWVPQTSPWRPSRSQMTKNASRSRLVSQTSSPPYSGFLVIQECLETRPGNVSVQGFGSANQQIRILDQSWSAGRMKRIVSACTIKKSPSG